ncbi:MAG TPA: AgmX/PglI C-terminal domain-containing protein [Polyangiaceae bacterium]
MKTFHPRPLALLTALLVLSCGGSAEPEAKSPDRAEKAAETRGPALPELDVMKVARALRGNEASLRDCFASDGAPVRGFMRMAFEVEGTGTVSNVEVETSSFAEPAVATCLADKISGLHFEAPGAKAKTHWTFVSGLYEKPAEDEPSKKHSRKKEKHLDDPEQGVLIDAKSRGSLEPDEIEDIVHAGFGLFAHCYREGLDRHPRLAGVVRLRMVIGRDGVVDHLRDAESDIPDPEVIDCVAEGFFALQFPKPRSGTVRLLYRIVFDNG